MPKRTEDDGNRRNPKRLNYSIIKGNQEVEK